jgi:lysophospholipase L1-like esterase
MTGKLLSRIRYFDLAAAAIALLVTSGLLLGRGARGSWPSARLWIVVSTAVVCACFIALRQRAYTQNTPWLIAACAAALCIAMVGVFWRLPLMWFVVVMSMGAVMLLAGLLAPAKPLGEPLTRLEVFKLLTVAGTVVLTLGAAEGFLRLAPGVFDEQTQQLLAWTPGNAGVGHPYIGHLHRPERSFDVAGKDFGARHSVDALGFRNRWPWPERPEIVAVGDSLTFGLGVGNDQAWPALVAHATGRRVINLGLVGAGPQQYLRLWETFGARLQPKLLIVGIYAQNDFWDAQLFDQWRQLGVGDNYMVWRDFGRPRRFRFRLRDPIVMADSLFRAHVYPVLRSSHLYNLLHAYGGGDLQAVGEAQILELAGGGRLQLAPADFVRKIRGAEAHTPQFRLVIDALQRLHAAATDQGTHVLMILQPGKEEVYLPVAGEQAADPTLALREAFDTLGLPYLDLAPAFRRRAEAGEQLFFEIDSHPNETGYAFIGQMVASHIGANASRYGLED